MLLPTVERSTDRDQIVSESHMNSYNNAAIRTAHDVRTMQACAYCKGHGNDHSMIYAHTTYWHGRCFIASKGEQAFMALPISQTGKLRLDDIGPEYMRKLIAAR